MKRRVTIPGVGKRGAAAAVQAIQGGDVVPPESMTAFWRDGDAAIFEAEGDFDLNLPAGSSVEIVDGNRVTKRIDIIEARAYTRSELEGD